METVIIDCKTYELIGKRTRSFFIFYGILWSLMLLQPVTNLDKYIEYFHNNPITNTFIYSLVIGTGIWLWYNALDTSPKIIVNKFGLWTKPSKLVQWDELHYYYFVKGKHQGKVSYNFKFKIKDSDKLYSLSLFQLDKGYTDILKAIEQYTSGKNIQYLGVDE